MRKNKKVALSAILSALATVIICAGSVLGTVDIAIAVAASVCVLICSCEFGYKNALLIYIVVSILAFVLAPSKISAVLFTCLFGMYPVVKNYSEARFGKLMSYIVKYIYLNVAMIVFIVFVKVFLSAMPILVYLVAVPVANVVLPLYDFLMSEMIGFYYKRIRQIRKQ